MPIYEYRCPKGHVFEVFQRMDDLPPDKCEVCGATPVERVLYPVAVHYKGSGYSTDYGRSRKRGGGEESSDGGSGGEKSESKSSRKAEKTSGGD